MASRRKARILAFQSIFSWEVTRKPAAEAADFSWLERTRETPLDQGLVDFSRLLVIGTIENIKAVDKMIRAHLENWDFSRLNRVDLAVLRMSAYTLMYQSDMAPSIVIAEAIGIVKEYGTDDSYRFVNGVLDAIRKTLEKKT